MSLVSLANIRGDGIPSIRQSILEALELINYRFIREVKNVVIKPNLCYYWDYSTGQTTDSKFVAALIDIIRERISAETSIQIVESDASAMRCKHVFKMLGYEKLSRDYGVRLVNLSEDRSTLSEVTVGKQVFHMAVPQTIRNADLRINVPKIKYAVEGLQITCALKNIFGCNPHSKKFIYHPRLGEVIVALNKAMNFNLCIIDGNIVSGMQPCRLGLVMASEDPVAIDAAAARIAGLNPSRISYIQLASKEGVGNTRFVPKGAPLKHFRMMYPKRNLREKLIGKAYSLTVRMGLGKRLGIE